MAESNLPRRTLAMIATALAAMVLLAAWGIGEARAVVPGENGRIAFASDRDGDWEIYSMNADGTNQKRLTNDALDDTEPTFSPDGSTIAFAKEFNGNQYIYTMDADGTDQTPLTASPGTSFEPAFSPDGRKIAFVRNRDSGYDIWVMDADGSNQTQLTNDESTNGQPAWSPDGTRITYTSDRDTPAGELYTMNADGTDQTRVTDNSEQVYDRQPSYAPDGSRIALARGVFQSNIFVTPVGGNPNGEDDTRLTAGMGDEEDPSYAPDGSRIAYTSDQDGNREIYAMNADGTGQTNLTRTAGNDIQPDWAPLSADLSLTQSDTPDPVTKGDVLSYTLRVTNSGYDTNPNVVLTDRLPSGVEFDSASSVCTHASGTVTCDLGDMAARSSRTVTISVRPQNEGTITNTATVSGGIDDPFTADNSDRESTQVILNVTPTADNDFYSGTEDQDLRVGPPGVLENDADANGDRLTATLVEGPENAASFSLDSNGGFTYTPEANFNGLDVFTYRTKDDGNVQSDLATVYIRIRSVNDRPVASDDTARTEKNTPVTINVLGNDLDPDGDRLTILDTAGPSHGTVAVNPDNTLTYTPDRDYVSEAGSPDTFGYTIQDPSGERSTARISVEVGDTGAPTVVRVSPPNATRTASAAANVEVTFSERMDPATLDGTTFTLLKEGDSTPVDATVRLDSTGKKAILDPTQPLDPQATYTATVKGGTGGVTDLSGNELAGDEVWFFSVNSAPKIDGLKPLSDSQTTNRTPTIGAKVTDAQSELSAGAITLTLDGNAVTSFAYNRDTDRLTYKPGINLSFGTHTVSVSAKDPQGLTRTRTWSFKVIRG